MRPNPIVQKGSKQEFREANNVRQLSELEDGLKLSALNGVFGFVYLWSLPFKDVESINLKRDNVGLKKLEVHKTKQGKVYICVYVAENDRVKLMDPSRGSLLEIIAFADEYREYKHLVGIPILRLSKIEHRPSAIDIIDLTVR